MKKLLTISVILFFLGLTYSSSSNADFLYTDNSIHENHNGEEFNGNETIVVTMGPLIFSEIKISC